VSPRKRTPQRRGERVAPPPAKEEWDVVFATGDAVDGWEELSRHAPGPTRGCWEKLRTDPFRHDRRQHPLRNRLGTRQIGEKTLNQWQYEVTGAGRVWYCPDPDERTVWLTDASVGHPEATESEEHLCPRPAADTSARSASPIGEMAGDVLERGRSALRPRHLPDQD
jgi:hypothetical protein